MIALTLDQALTLGYTVRHSKARRPLIVGPDGREFTKCESGDSADVVIESSYQSVAPLYLKERDTMGAGAMLRLLKMRRGP